jgi:hypothetical protein
MNHAGAGRVITRDAQVSPEALDAQGAAADAGAPGTAHGRPAVPRHAVVRRAARELAVAAGFLAAGIAATWPRITYLATGQVPGKSDEGQYIWGLWWTAHQVTQLENPWFTRAMAAPVGTYLGFHTLMPLPGLLLTPVTLAFGAVFSFNLLCVAAPGLACYTMYRAARLWLPRRAGAIAAGAFFGLSANLTWRSWYHLNIALGTLFLPLALEAAVWLTRKPGGRQAVILGLVAGASMLVDQITAIMVAFVAVAVLLPWLARGPSVRKLALAAVAGLAGLAVASPQLAAMGAQWQAGAASLGSGGLARSYLRYAVGLPQLFGPSPRVAAVGLKSLGLVYYHGHTGEGVSTFGLVLSASAILGLAASWRRRQAWLLALGWIACATLALGPVLWIGTRQYVPFAEVSDGYRLSAVMPYTWFVRLPGMGNFREAARFTLLGMMPAALLAGSAVDWLRRRAEPLLAGGPARRLLAPGLLAPGLLAPGLLAPGLLALGLLALGLLEAGWAGNLSITPRGLRVPAVSVRLPAVDGPIADDHSNSIVVDVPYGLWGGTGLYGAWLRPQALALATMDGHPRGEAYISRVPVPVSAAIKRHPFYARLVDTQHGAANSAADLAAARADARRMGVGWVLVWHRGPGVVRYLTETGFRFDYRADGVSVYRPAGQARRLP